jgi:acyl-CoA synthetase (AMP-forming)/AMP-acid ligase II
MNFGAELYGERAAYLVKDRPGGRFVPVSFRQFRADVTALGAALMDAGHIAAPGPAGAGRLNGAALMDAGHIAAPGPAGAVRADGRTGIGAAGAGRVDSEAGIGAAGAGRRKLAIISENRYEYVVAYFAVVCGGGVVVPIDPRLPAAEVAGLMRRSGAHAIFCSKKYEASVREDGTARISMDEIPSLIAFGERLIRSGDDRYFRAETDPKGMCSLLFTSGTTGAAKGVMLSQSGLMSNVVGMSAFIDAGGMVTLSVLPMHHALEFTCDILAAMYQGCTVAICEGLRYIMRDLAGSGAQVIVGVPLVFEKMHRSIMRTALRAGRYGLLRGMIDFAKLAGGNVPARLMFRSVRKALGGRVKLFLVGGAPCDPRVISDFNAMGIRMIQGYGLTENSPIISLGMDRHSKDDSVGLPLRGSYVQIDDADADGVGEIVISGPSVMLGYYGDPAATKEAMPDGRLRTGDLGRFDEDGFLYITGRVKNVIVLKNGKNVYPEEVEGHLLKSQFIEEAVVSGAPRGDAASSAGDAMGAGRRPASPSGAGRAGGAAGESPGDLVVLAEVFPDAEAIRRAFGEAGPDDVRKIIDREVDKANETMPPHMRVRRVAIRPAPFDKTTTKKIRRAPPKNFW